MMSITLVCSGCCRSPASPLTKERFVPLATQAVDVSVGMRLLVKRSNGDWCHAEVCAYEAWPPEGGTVTLQVGDGLRKTLNLAKERHIAIVRVPLPKSAGRRGRSRRGGGDRRNGGGNAAESPEGAKSPPARTASANSFAMSDAFTAEGPGSSHGGNGVGGNELEDDSEEELQGSRQHRGNDRRSRSRSRDGYHSTGARSRSASRDRLSPSPAGGGAASSPPSPPLASSARPRSTSRERNNSSNSRGRSSAGRGDDDTFRFGGSSGGGFSGGELSGLAPLPNMRKPSSSAGRPARNASPPVGGSYGSGGGPSSRSASMPPPTSSPSSMAPSPFSLPPGLNALSSAGAASHPNAIATTPAAGVAAAPGSPPYQQQRVGASLSPLHMLDQLLSPGPLSPSDSSQPMRYLSQASFEAADFGPASSSGGNNGVLSPSRDASGAIPEEDNGGALGGPGGGGGYSGGEEDSGGEGGEAGRGNSRSSSSGGGAARDGHTCDLETAKVLFKSMAEPMPLDKGAKVIVQRSDSSWAHATVSIEFTRGLFLVAVHVFLISKVYIFMANDLCFFVALMFHSGGPVRELASGGRHGDRQTRQNHPQSPGPEQAPPLAAAAAAERPFRFERDGRGARPHQTWAWPDDWQRRGTFTVSAFFIEHSTRGAFMNLT